MNLQVRVKTDLLTEPVTSAEAKLWCKVTGTADDSIFTLLIPAARKALEKYTSSSFAEKTIHATWIERPEDDIFELPYGPIISVDKVYLIDEEGTEEEITITDDYYVYGDQDATVKLVKYWSTGITSASSVRIEYKAGYGHTNTETLPTDLKIAILKLIAKSYQFRGDEIGAAVLDSEIKKEAAPYRRSLWF